MERCKPQPRRRTSPGGHRESSIRLQLNRIVLLAFHEVARVHKREERRDPDAGRRGADARWGEENGIDEIRPISTDYRNE